MSKIELIGGSSFPISRFLNFTVVWGKKNRTMKPISFFQIAYDNEQNWLKINEM